LLSNQSHFVLSFEFGLETWFKNSSFLAGPPPDTAIDGDVAGKNAQKRRESATDICLFLHSHFLTSETAEGFGVSRMLKARFR
jgi:hypothetical protein